MTKYKSNFSFYLNFTKSKSKVSHKTIIGLAISVVQPWLHKESLTTSTITSSRHNTAKLVRQLNIPLAILLNVNHITQIYAYLDDCIVSLQVLRWFPPMLKNFFVNQKASNCTTFLINTLQNEQWSKKFASTEGSFATLAHRYRMWSHIKYCKGPT